jgi:hypothetical protein
MKPDPEDTPLQEALRQALPAEDSATLQERVLAQWQQRHASAQGAALQRGSGGQLMLARWRDHPLRWLGAALLASSMLVLAWCGTRPDPGVQELMQLDVLSQIAIGEL